MAAPLTRSLSTRTVKKLEKPRPLKMSSSQTKVTSELSPHVPLQDLMILVENSSQSLLDKNYDETLTANVAVMYSKLKIHGQQLETIFKDQLDRAFVVFRNACQDDGLLFTTRLHLLELVELRANQWSNSDNTLVYYSAKMAATDIEPFVTTPDANTTTPLPLPSPSSPIPPALGPGEVLKTSGKFPKPTKVPGKNYCKDEVVIRNADSGKAEFIRPPIIKCPVSWNTARYLYPPHFFRPYYPPVWIPRSACLVNPGAKERLVQITGPSEDKIVHARQLMEDTIRRNASPVREGVDRERMGGSSSSLNSSASDESNRLIQPGSRRSALLHSYSTNDANLGEYKFTVTIGNDTVKITGSNFQVVHNSRLVLEEYYNVWLQKNCTGDCYGIDEDVFVDPVVQDMMTFRLNSVDSGNGNGPSTSSGDSDDITCINTLSPPGVSFDPSLGYQAMYPVGQLERRPVLGRSNSTPMAGPPLSPQSQGVSRKYSKEFLLECSNSHHSRAPPHNWDQITLECPAIAKKGTPPFDVRAYYAKRTSGSATSVISANQIGNEPESD
ncbi:eukaryotic translation initiation factor 4E-binding protein Mextli isoform X3 [Homalodisca vitripennis]|uniref:eukaryotic translation initiation factor 4E-binding protein Mextli isoform X3 n=1 Tax=Homalodisca vitripennis TaxID=197043 RepID=UPI001EEAD150|nr:eukaryotic translation initiation factor 4E-binding protein Mextli isoform X3 [Homalodisca vitripennis]